MQRLRFSITLVVSLAAFPAAALGQSNQQGTLVLAASQDTVRFGTGVTLSGKLTGRNADNKSVTLREDPFPFGAFDNVAITSTTAEGDYAFNRTPAVNSRYQARQGGRESQIVTVGVSPALSLRVGDRTPRAGRRVRFSGRVCPEHDGARLAVQRRVRPKRWRTVRRATLTDVANTLCSAYSRRVRVRRDGVYRAFLAAHDDHVAGRSRVRRLDVHR